jgi:hypothetical protein
MSVTIYDGDRDDLRAEGWEFGAYWSEPGSSGYWARSNEHHPEWIRLRCTPCSDDSLRDDDGFCGPCGPVDSATEALLDRVTDVGYN